jgi:hypothetical protein
MELARQRAEELPVIAAEKAFIVRVLSAGRRQVLPANHDVPEGRGMKTKMKRTAHSIAGTLLIAALFPLGLTVSAGSASAANCSGYSCHGLDPSGRCTDTASKWRYATIGGVLDPEPVAILYNKYSKSCNSNWAWAALTPEGRYAGLSMVLFITTSDSRGNLESMCYPGPSNTGNLNEYCYNYNYTGTLPFYTDMVDGTHVTQAYLYIYDASTGALLTSAEVDL